MTLINNLARLFLATLVAAFVYGMFALFALRFEEGEMFPPYSSLRSDPLGAKGLYQALERLPGLTVERHYHALDKTSIKGDSTLLYLGLPSGFLNRPQNPVIDQLEDLTSKGGRIVISFRPVNEASGCEAESRKHACASLPVDETNPSETGKDSDDSTGDRDGSATPGDRWAIRPLSDSRSGSQERPVWSASLQKPAEGLPSSIPVRSRLRFEVLDGDWKTLYSVDEQPVIVERTMGHGSLVLVADSFLFSNEAMRGERSPGLLLWLFGPNGRLVFDELHFGVRDQIGFMDLVRKHRLTGFLIALLVLGGLFVWKNAVPFLPATQPHPVSPAGSAHIGRDLAGRLTHLLRRNISPGQLIRVCFDEWDRAVGQHDRGLKGMRRELMKIVDAQQDGSDRIMEPTAVYNRISKILSEGKTS